MRFWVIRHGVIPASRGGKMKTLAQGIGRRDVRPGADRAAGHAALLGDGGGRRADRGHRSRLRTTGHRAAPRRARASARPQADAAAEERGTAVKSRRPPRCCALLDGAWRDARRRRVADRRSGGRGDHLRPRGLAGPSAARSRRTPPTSSSELLGVDGALLAERGAVDRAGRGRRWRPGCGEVLGADWGIATTGVAGPGPAGRAAGRHGLRGRRRAAGPALAESGRAAVERRPGGNP